MMFKFICKIDRNINAQNAVIILSFGGMQFE